MLRPGSSISYNSAMASKVSIDAHPTDAAIVIRMENGQKSKNGSLSSLPRSRAVSANMEMGITRKVINLKDLSLNVDINALTNIIMQKCPYIPSSSRRELEQVLHYLQKRSTKSLIRSRSSSAVSLERRQMQNLVVDMNKIDDYIECFYAESQAEKNRGAMSILELSKNEGHIEQLTQNETLIGALARVFREDWKRNFDVSTNIMLTFVNISKFVKYHHIIMHHKVGSLSLSAIEHETKRFDSWTAEMKKADTETTRKLKTAIRKQSHLLSACINLLTNISVDIGVELKMIRRDLVSLLLRCLGMSTDSSTTHLTLSSVRFLLKLSIFEENIRIMEHYGIVEKLAKMFPIADVELRKMVIRLLFNCACETKNIPKMVDEGLVPHIASLIEEESKAINVLYRLSCNDDAKAMLAFTDAIQLLMRDVLSGTGSDITKAVLLNTCVEKRNAQLVSGADGQGLDLLMELALSSRDLMIIKVIRAIAQHQGPTQAMFQKWIPQLIEIVMADGLDSSESKSSFALECIGTLAELRDVGWANILKEYDLVEWMRDLLQHDYDEPDEAAVMNERKPIQLQIVVACGTMARQLDAARCLMPLIDSFIHLLKSTQIDDEFVVQLLFVFLQMLRHKELAKQLMTPDSELGAHMIDLMHDANSAVREICDNALIIMEEHSNEWAKLITTERFKWHNMQWLEMVEKDDPYEDDDYAIDMNFDYDDGFDINEPLF